MTDLLVEFPNMIRSELARRGMSQRQLAAEVDTNSSTITRLLNRQGMCDVATFVRLAAWLRVGPEEFGDEQIAAAYRRGRDDVIARFMAVAGDSDG